MEPELEGDKAVDLDHHNLGEELPLLLPLIFLFFPFSPGFLSSSPLEDELIFVTLGGGYWMEGKSSPSTHVQSPKSPSAITLMGSGLLQLFGLPKRLQMIISSQPT